MKEFWELVGNNRRIGLWRSRTWWRIAYFALISLVLLVLLAIAIYRGELPPFILLVIIPYLIFAGFGISIRSIKKEWREQTAVWWLTLPYSRRELLLAKAVAAFLQFLKLVVWSVLLMAAIALLGSALNPAVWTVRALTATAESAVKLYLLMLAASPLAIALGLFTSVVQHSRLKPLSPIVWMVQIYGLVSLVGYGLYRIAGQTDPGALGNSYMSFQIGTPLRGLLLPLPLLIALLWLVAVGIGVLAAYILQSQTEA